MKFLPPLVIPLWFLGPLAVYLRTMTGSFLADDSPETISAMAELSHQHPPGYPAFTLLGRVAMLLPVGGAAYRVTLLAAVAAALACWLCAQIARQLGRRWGLDDTRALIAGSVAASLMAFSWTFWSQALSAKGGVYTLNACVLGGLVWVALRWLMVEAHPARSLAVTGLLLGIGLAHHWMSVLAGSMGILALWAMVLVRDRIPRGPGIMAGCLLLLGLSLYLLLPIRANTPLLLNWGRPHTAKQAVWVVSRAHYRAIEMGKRPEGYWGVRSAHLSTVWTREWTPWLFWPGALGIVLLAARLRRELIVIAGPAVMVLVGVVFVAHPPLDRLYIIEPYLVPVFQMWAVLGGLALGWAAGRWRDRYGLGWLIPGGIAAALVAVHGPKMNMSSYYLSYDYGWNLLQGLSSRSVVFCEAEYDLFSLLYHDRVDRRREDVAVTAAVFLDYDWYRETVHRMLPDVIPRAHELFQYTVNPSRPLVYTSRHAGGDDVLRPVGLTLRPPLGEGYGLEDSTRIWKSLRFRGLWDLFARGSRTARGIIATYSLQMARLGKAARTEDSALSVAAFLEAIRLPQFLPSRVITRYNLAQMLLQTQASSEEGRRQMLGLAEAQLARIVVEAPGYYRAYVLQGNIAFLRGDRERARGALRRALQALPAVGAEAERARVAGLLRNL